LSSLRGALWGLFAAAVALAAVMVALTVTSDHESAKIPSAILGPFIGLSFVGTGVYAWARRPHSRFGALMAGVGFAWFIAGLTESNDPWLFTAGAYVGPLYLVLAAHMLLAFPDGRLQTTGQRVLIIVGYLNILLVGLLFFVLGGRIDDPVNAPDNAFAIVDQPESAQVFLTLSELIGFGIVVGVVVALLRKRRDASAPQRRAMAPVLWTGLALSVALGVAVLQSAFGASNRAQSAPGLAALVCFAALPWAFLVGLLRTRYSRAGAVSDLIERLNERRDGASLRDALALALGDRSLTLAYWSRSSERYVDAGGRPVSLPDPRARGRAVTEIEHDGQPVAAIVHDSALLDEPGLVRAAGAAAALALENERLEAELKARVAELQTSRSKLLEVGMAERRALERNLHDGAQQRLVALSLQLGLARAKVRDAPDAAERILDTAREELASALEELRELARGIHPAVLSDRGLAPALEVLAGRSPVPVEIADVPEGRMPGPVEAAAYFVVAESLTNMAKYAEADSATVRVTRENGYAVIEIKDDGVGGADPTAGSGLRGLADRLAAMDGRLDVYSPPGFGTIIRARIPCA
jgi:signal transduction histidine kinase